MVERRGGWRIVVFLVVVSMAMASCSSDGDVLAGLWDYDENEPFHTAKAEGLLLVEGLCVYIVDDYSWLLPDTPLEELPEPVRIFVNLPREQTQYDLDTGSIWVHDYGPITSGDRVEIVGGGINPSLPDACSVSVDRVVNVKSMKFKQCKLWFPLDHWSQMGLARFVARIGGAGGVGGRFGGCRAARGSDVSALGLVVACGARVDRFGGAAGCPGAGFGVKAGWLGGWVLSEPGGEVAAGASLPVGEGGDEGVDLVADEVELDAVGADGVGAAVAEAFFEVVVG